MTTHDRPHDHHDHEDLDLEQLDWDTVYGAEDVVDHKWSGQPNGALVVEVADLTPGSALDVGCGEGADAIWLAQRGWTVTAVEPSGIALERARAAADTKGADVTWIHAGLVEMPAGTGTHDLVSAQYPVLFITPDNAAVDALLGAVAPGGTLLLVHHDLDDAHAAERGFDPSRLVTPATLAPMLDADAWDIEVNETRPRPGNLGADAKHTHDVILRARRR